MKRSKYSYYENAIQLRLNDGLSVSGIAKDICSGDESLVYNSLRCHINDGIKNGKYTAVSVETSTGNDTVGDDYKEPHAFGQAFTDYCSRMQINPENVESAKAINHLAGGQEFNIVLKSAVSETDGIDFDALIKKHAKRMKAIKKPLFQNEQHNQGAQIGFINLNDLHLGMNPNEGGTGLAGSWDTEDYQLAIHKAVKGMADVDYSEIHLNIIGDIIDGQDKKTTRGKTGESGHVLPQNKTNLEQFEAGTEFITHLVIAIKNRFEDAKVFVHALSNSNHGGDMEHFMLRLAQTNVLYLAGVNMTIERKSMMVYPVGGKEIVLIHGKDEKYDKRGMPFELNGEQMHDTHDLMVVNGCKMPNPIMFRADLHQAKVSYLRKFVDVLCPAWCPSSQYAQHNYANYGRGSAMCAVYNVSTQQLVTYVIQF